MKTKKEWFNDNSFWEHFAPIMFDDAHWGEVGAVADGITRLAGLDLYGPADGAPRSAPRCLDLCCGFGRISLELARRGFSVTGVDITKSYLEAAKEDASADKTDACFILEDIRNFKEQESFDLAINMYNSFGYFEDPADDITVLRNALESLKSGGTFFIETFGREIVSRDFIEGEWFERAGYFVLTEYEALDSWNILGNRWILIDKKTGDIFEKRFMHRLYSAQELKRLLLETGFAGVDLYGDWDESPYDDKAVKLIAAAHKEVI